MFHSFLLWSKRVLLKVWWLFGRTEGKLGGIPAPGDFLPRVFVKQTLFKSTSCFHIWSPIYFLRTDRLGGRVDLTSWPVDTPGRHRSSWYHHPPPGVAFVPKLLLFWSWSHKHTPDPCDKNNTETWQHKLHADMLGCSETLFIVVFLPHRSVTFFLFPSIQENNKPTVLHRDEATFGQEGCHLKIRAMWRNTHKSLGQNYYRTSWIRIL